MPFENDILAGEELVRSAMRSENFTEGPPQEGWRITRDGQASFTGIDVSDGVITGGTIQTAEPPAARIEIDSDGMRAYDDTNHLRVEIGQGDVGGDPMSQIEFPTGAVSEEDAATIGGINAGTRLGLGIFGPSNQAGITGNSPRLFLYSGDSIGSIPELIQFESSDGQIIDIGDAAITLVVNDIRYGEYVGTGDAPTIATWENVSLSGSQGQDGGAGQSLHRVKRLPGNMAIIQYDCGYSGAASGALIGTLPSWAVPGKPHRVHNAHNASAAVSCHVDFGTGLADPDGLHAAFVGTPTWIAFTLIYSLDG